MRCSELSQPLFRSPGTGYAAPSKRPVPPDCHPQRNLLPHEKYERQPCAYCVDVIGDVRQWSLAAKQVADHGPAPQSRGVHAVLQSRAASPGLSPPGPHPCRALLGRRPSMTSCRTLGWSTCLHHSGPGHTRGTLNDDNYAFSNQKIRFPKRLAGRWRLPSQGE